MAGSDHGSWAARGPAAESGHAGRYRSDDALAAVAASSPAANQRPLLSRPQRVYAGPKGDVSL
jgi:hypothetical protein